MKYVGNHAFLLVSKKELLCYVLLYLWLLFFLDICDFFLTWTCIFGLEATFFPVVSLFERGNNFVEFFHLSFCRSLARFTKGISAIVSNLQSSSFWLKKKWKNIETLQPRHLKFSFSEKATTIYAIGSLTAEHKASFSLVFSDINYRQNIAGR